MNAIIQNIKTQAEFFIDFIKENSLLNFTWNVISRLILSFLFMFAVAYILIMLFFIQVYFLIPCAVIIYVGSNILFHKSPENMFVEPFLSQINIAPTLLVVLGGLVSIYIEFIVFDFIKEKLRKSFKK